VPHGSTDRIRSGSTIAFGQMFLCQRILGDKIIDIAQAMAPGGHGDPFKGLNTNQREELSRLYKLGFPRGDEYMISQPLGQMWLWTSMAESLADQDPSYFENFWTQPGYVGHDQPEFLGQDILDKRAKVKRVLTGGDVLADPRFEEPRHQNFRMLVSVFSSLTGDPDLPVAIELEDVGPGYRLGAAIKPVSGEAAGRALYCASLADNVYYCDGEGDANLLRFKGVKPGDEVHIDNRKFLAFHYFARHHVLNDLQFADLMVDGVATYPQHPVPMNSPLMGVGYSGKYEGKLMWVHHTKDSSLWPPNGVIYRDAVFGAQGEAGAKERFRLRWIENAEHGPAAMAPSLPNRASNTWLIDYMPFIEQSLADLIDWVEKAVSPVDTAFEWTDNKVILSPDATERRGIQAVIAVTANGGARAEVAVGASVTLEMQADVPPGAGAIVEAEWDFDGKGTFPFKYDGIDGRAPSVTLSTTHVFDKPGEYFVTGRVHSHRKGDVSATACRIPNVAQARVVVT
jgi:hypothetical protein